MPRRPFSGECSVIVGREPGAPGERVYVSELARYLNVSSGLVAAFAQQNGWLKLAGRGGFWAPVRWVTPYAAAQIITFFRAKEGQLILAGKDPEKLREQQRRCSARAHAARRAAREAERQQAAIAGILTKK